MHRSRPSCKADFGWSVCQPPLSRLFLASVSVGHTLLSHQTQSSNRLQTCHERMFRPRLPLSLWSLVGLHDAAAVRRSGMQVSHCSVLTRSLSQWSRVPETPCSIRASCRNLMLERCPRRKSNTSKTWTQIWSLCMCLTIPNNRLFVTLIVIMNKASNHLWRTPLILSTFGCAEVRTQHHISRSSQRQRGVE